MSFRNQRGIALVTTVMLIIFISLTVFGVTTFIVGRFAQIQTQLYRLKAHYLAQAGIESALYDFRVSDHAGIGRFSLGQTDVGAQDYFITGGFDADFVLVDASQVVIAGKKNEEFRNLTIQNANNTRPVTIDRMIVRWDVQSRKLRSVSIGGSKVWVGNGNTPATIDIKDFTLDAVPTVYPIDVVQFDKDIRSVGYVDMGFIMLDGSSRSVRIYPAHSGRSFVVRATGRTDETVHYRSVMAEYDVPTGRIIDYKEIPDAIIP